MKEYSHLATFTSGNVYIATKFHCHQYLKINNDVQGNGNFSFLSLHELIGPWNTSNLINFLFSALSVILLTSLSRRYLAVSPSTSPWTIRNCNTAYHSKHVSWIYSKNLLHHMFAFVEYLHMYNFNNYVTVHCVSCAEAFFEIDMLYIKILHCIISSQDFAQFHFFSRFCISQIQVRPLGM